jgi:hypothetical protein
MSFLSHRNLAGGLRAVQAVRTARGPNPLIIKEHGRKHTSKCGRCGWFAQAPDFAGAGGVRAVRVRAPHTPQGARARPWRGRACARQAPCPPRPARGTLVAARHRVILAALNNHYRARGP